MMMRSLVVHDIPISHVAAMERWYFREHSPEVVRRYGPWIARHESFLPVDAPQQARQFGYFNWRVTDVWWRELPLDGPRGTYAFTVAPVTPRVATCFIPAQPTEDFMGHEIQPFERQQLRWFVLMRYPEGVSREEGDEWFLKVHAPEVCQQRGLYRFFSYKVVEPGQGLPGIWPPHILPEVLQRLMPRWHRVCELWYETFEDWERAVLTEPPRYTRPKWARFDRYPFLEPGNELVSSFLLERPNDEFSRDSRGYT
jgi:hypothetical protein